MAGGNGTGGGTSQAENDLWSNTHNPNNDATKDDWADAHNPNTEDYLGEHNIGRDKS